MAIDPRYLFMRGAPGVVVFVDRGINLDAMGNQAFVPQHQPQQFYYPPPQQHYVPQQYARRDSPVQHQQVHQVRGSGVVQFELLGQVRNAIAQALAQNKALVDGSTWRDRRDTAEQLAGAVLQTLGVQLPPIEYSDGRERAHVSKGRIEIGEDLARSLSLPALMQVLLHAAGEAHEGRDHLAASSVLRSLYQAQLISAQQTERVEHVSEVYAALGAWMFEAAQRPEKSEWAHALRHPSSSEAINIIVGALDRAFNAPPPWAFGDAP